MDVTIWVVDVIDVSLVLVMNKSQQGRARIYVNAQFVFSTQRNAAPAVDSDGRSCVVRHAQHNPVRSDKTDKWMYDCVGFGSPIQLNRNMIMQMIHTHRKKQYACFCVSLVQINPVREPLLSQRCLCSSKFCCCLVHQLINSVASKRSISCTIEQPLVSSITVSVASTPLPQSRPVVERRMTLPMGSVL